MRWALQVKGIFLELAASGNRRLNVRAGSSGYRSGERG